MVVPQTERVKIAYVTLNGAIPSTSANSVGVMTMCGEFAALGLETLLVVPGGQGASSDELSHAGDVGEFYSVSAPFTLKYFPNLFSGRLSYFRVLYSLSIVLYLRARKVSLMTTRYLEVAVWAAILRIPVILESHNYARFASNKLIRLWVRLARNGTRCVSMVVTTSAGKRSCVDLGIPAHLIRVCPNGVNVDRFQGLETNNTLRESLGLPDVTIVGFSGSLGEGRGVEEILWCASRLSGLHFLIVGGTPSDVDRYRKLSNSMAVTNVTFVGHVPQADVPRYLLASDILLMPYSTKFAEHSFEYTSPMKMFDYLAAGRPIIATDFPVLHEILDHRVNAIFVSPDSGQELADGIQILIDDPDLARRIAAQARCDANRYTWENRARGIIEWQRDIGSIR